MSRLALRKSPDAEKQLKIEQKDERNIAIRGRAKGKAFDLMAYVQRPDVFLCDNGSRFCRGFAAGFRLPACNRKLMQLKISTLMFGLMTIVFCVLYCVIACILIYSLAPKTFRIRV